MPDKGTSEEGDALLGEGIVAILPHAAVEGVHVFGFAGDDAEGHTAADDLSVGGEVGLDAVVFLGAAGSGTEAGDDLVEDEDRSGLPGDLAHLADEFAGLEFGTAALDRLDDDRSDLVGTLADDLESLVGAIGQHDHVIDSAARDAGSDGERTDRVAGADALHEHFVEVAVVVLCEDDDLVATRHGTGKAHRGLDGLGSGIDEAGTFVAGDLTEELRGLHRVDALRTDLDTAVELGLQCFGHEVGRVAEEVRSEAIEEIDVFIAIDVDEARALRFLDRDLVDHFLPTAVEA